jgi:hypothetical protein
LAYDASLQGMKACLLQYKRGTPLVRSRGVSISLNSNQLATLTSKYRPGNSPYVFIGASEFWTYQEFGNAVLTSHPIARAHHVLYVDAHAIPPKATTLRLQRQHPTGPPYAFPFGGRIQVGGPLQCLNGLDIVRRLLTCEVGHQAGTVTEFTSRIDRPGAMGRISILFMTPTA